MSFSFDTKNELCRLPVQRLCCARAEAYGILLYCNTFQSTEVRVVTENPNFAARLPRLFHRAFGLRFDRQPEAGEDGELPAGKMVFQITDIKKLDHIINLLGYDPRQNPVLHINFALLEFIQQFNVSVLSCQNITVNSFNSCVRIKFFYQKLNLLSSNSGSGKRIATALRTKFRETHFSVAVVAFEFFYTCVPNHWYRTIRAFNYGSAGFTLRISRISAPVHKQYHLLLALQCFTNFRL